MGILDSILGQLLGGANSPLGGILGSLLGGGGSAGAGAGGGGLLDQLRRAGLGEQVESWIGSGPNRPVDPGRLRDAFGQDQVSQWSRQSGMSEGDILSQLSDLLPKAVDQATPEGRVPSGGIANPFASDQPGTEESPFGAAGTEFPPRG